MWLGLHKHKKDYLRDAPKGFQMVRKEIQSCVPLLPFSCFFPSFICALSNFFLILLLLSYSHFFCNVWLIFFDLSFALEININTLFLVLNIWHFLFLFQPKGANKMMAPPPNQLIYTDRQKFILRSHIYQARSLIGSDASGLSGMSNSSIYFYFPNIVII